MENRRVTKKFLTYNQKEDLSVGSPQLRWGLGVGGNVILKWILQKYVSSFYILLLCIFNSIDALITLYNHCISLTTL